MSHESNIFSSNSLVPVLGGQRGLNVLHEVVEKAVHELLLVGRLLRHDLLPQQHVKLQPKIATILNRTTTIFNTKYINSVKKKSHEDQT